MSNYIIFIKDNESKILLAELVTRELSRELKGKGFTRYPYIIAANNEKEAIQKLNKQGSAHLNELSQFSGSLFYYCVVLVSGLIVAFIFYR